jgi:hypothetical protein
MASSIQVNVVPLVAKFRVDMNANGTIERKDANTAKRQIGTSLP